MGNLANILPVTLRFEGGWSDNPHDPGGATMCGITLATFRRTHPGATKDDLRAISEADKLEIYDREYFRPIGGSLLAPGVDLAAFDPAVNSGVGWANKALAATAGLAAVARVHAISARRLSFLHGLKTWSYFGKGWGARVASVEATAAKMALAGAGAPPAVITQHLTQKATEASAKSDKAAVGATTHATVTGSGALASTTQGAPFSVTLAILAAVVIGAAILGFVAWRQSQRASALSAAAKEA